MVIKMANVITLTAPEMAERDKEIKNAVKQQQNRLFDFIRRRVNTREDAEDILQDVFYQFSLHYSVVEPIRDVAAWMFRVAGNKIIDLYRKKKPEPMQVTLAGQDDADGEESFSFTDLHFDPSDIPDDQYTRNLFWKALFSALEELPAEQREVFVWHELEGKSFKDIAERTGQLVATLITRKRYAVLHLREALQSFYNELALKQ